MWTKIARLISWLLVIAVVAGWFVMLRPEALGGSTGYILVAGNSMVPTLNTGDLSITRAKSEYKMGDIVTFPVQNSLVIHRIVGGTAEEGYITRGDGKDYNDPWRVFPKDIAGEMWLNIPGGGRYATNLLSYLRQPLFFGAIAIAILALFLADAFVKKRRSRADILKQRHEYFQKRRWSVRI